MQLQRDLLPRDLRDSADGDVLHLHANAAGAPVQGDRRDLLQRPARSAASKAEGDPAAPQSGARVRTVLAALPPLLLLRLAASDGDPLAVHAARLSRLLPARHVQLHAEPAHLLSDEQTVRAFIHNFLHLRSPKPLSFVATLFTL